MNWLDVTCCSANAISSRVWSSQLALADPETYPVVPKLPAAETELKDVPYPADLERELLALRLELARAVILG